jgi:hypothetical protein
MQDLYAESRLTVNVKDVLGCQRALFEWAESYDDKDGERLKECIAPVLLVSTSIHTSHCGKSILEY